MFIVCSILIVVVSLIIMTKIYKIMYPEMILVRMELVLIPLRLQNDLSSNCKVFFSLKIPDVTERLRKDSEGRTLSSNLVFTIWAVFGGFILHFLLSNYLTVLLRPSYESPVDTAADIILRDITPFFIPGAESWISFFADSTDPNYQEISRRFVIAKDWDEFEDKLHKVTSTGMFAYMGTQPHSWYVAEEEYKDWYRSSERISGRNPYTVHLSNKKWPLKKVF